MINDCKFEVENVFTVREHIGATRYCYAFARLSPSNVNRNDDNNIII